MQLRSILPITFASLLFIACKKDDNGNDSTQVSASITGTWELRQTLSMSGVKTYAAGNGNVLRFTDTGYEKYAENRFIKKGPYATTPDTTVTANVCLNILSGQFAKRIIYDGNLAADKKFFQISNNKLTFVSGCFAADGGVQEQYQRQKDGTGPQPD